MLCPWCQAFCQLTAGGRDGDPMTEEGQFFGEGEDVGFGSAVAEGGGAEEDVHLVPLFDISIILWRL